MFVPASIVVHFHRSEQRLIWKSFPAPTTPSAFGYIFRCSPTLETKHFMNKYISNEQWSSGKINIICCFCWTEYIQNAIQGNLLEEKTRLSSSAALKDVVSSWLRVRPYFNAEAEFHFPYRSKIALLQQHSRMYSRIQGSPWVMV